MRLVKGDAVFGHRIHAGGVRGTGESEIKCARRAVACPRGGVTFWVVDFRRVGHAIRYTRIGVGNHLFAIGA